MEKSLEYALCDMQADLFVRSVEKQYDSQIFIKAFMNSKAAAALDLPYDPMQWSGTEYVLSCVEEEQSEKLIKSNNCYDKRIMYWIGYIYRYWHCLTGESSKDIYDSAPAEVMKASYFAFHTLSNRLAVTKLKEESKKKGRRKRHVEIKMKPGLYENDISYRGNGQNDDFFFLSPIARMSDEEDDFDRHWVFLTDKYKLGIKNALLSFNREHGLSLPTEDDLTSYENPDYLWLSYELLNLIRAYNQSVTNPFTGEIAEGYKHLPYVQIKLQALAFSVSSASPKSVYDPHGENGKGKYIIQFEQPFLKLYMEHVFSIFDDNPQLYHEENGQKVIDYQFVAPIYRQQPFAKYFDTRHDLPAIVFHKSIQMMIAHELAHIGGGHLDLQSADPIFGKNKDTLISEEEDADNQAVCWLLGIRIMESSNTTLDISYYDLFQELSLTVFSIYLLYTWNHKADDRRWSDTTVRDYGHKDHLPYQLRAYNSLNLCYQRLIKIGQWSEECDIVTKDKVRITADFTRAVFDEGMNMIHAYENSLYMSFARTEQLCRLANEGKDREIREMILLEQKEILPVLTKEQIPWRLGLEPQGQKELKRVHELWKTVREHLLQNGTYCKPAEYKEWIPLEVDEKAGY